MQVPHTHTMINHCAKNNLFYFILFSLFYDHPEWNFVCFFFHQLIGKWMLRCWWCPLFLRFIFYHGFFFTHTHTLACPTTTVILTHQPKTYSEWQNNVKEKKSKSSDLLFLPSESNVYMCIDWIFCCLCFFLSMFGFIYWMIHSEMVKYWNEMNVIVVVVIDDCGWFLQT